MAIVAVLAAVALPSFASLIERYRVTRVLEDLAGAYYFARSEALKRGGSVFLQKASTADCTRSAAKDWSCGWIVFHDADEDGVQAADGSEDPLYRATGSAGIEVTTAPAFRQLRFDRWGFPQANKFFNVTVRPERARADDPTSGCLVVAAGGRVSKKGGQVSCAGS